MNLLQETIKDAHLTVDQAFENYQFMGLSDQKVYANWLAQTYYYVHHVTRILAFAAAKCDMYQDKELHFRLITSLNEEKGHDKMVLNDLRKLGAELGDYPETIEARNFYQALFYMVETYGPYALVGYFIPQEGLACLKLGALYNGLKETYGEQSCSFLKKHVLLDVAHFGDALKYLERVPAEKLPAVRLGMFRSAELYAALMKAIIPCETEDRLAQYWKLAQRRFASNELES